MKHKKVLDITVSLLTIMLSGVTLFCLLLILTFRLDVVANITHYNEILLLTGGLVTVTTALVIAGKFLLTKEQLIHTLLASVLALIFIVSLSFLVISMAYSSDNVLLFFGGAVFFLILILQYLEKVNWRYIFATVYAAALVIIIMLTSTGF